MSLALAAAIAPLGFGFTGGGFLLTYFLGVIQALLESGALVPGVTPVAGGSAGALAAVTACSGTNITAAADAQLEFIAHCLATNPTAPCNQTLDALTRAQLEALVPADAAKRCRRTLALALTRPAGAAGALQSPPRVDASRLWEVRSFRSRADLLDAATAATYLACYSAGMPFGTFRSQAALAGGYSVDVLCPRGVARCVRVACSYTGPRFLPDNNATAATAASAPEVAAATKKQSSGGRRNALPRSCPVDLPLPKIRPDFPTPDIYPGKYSDVAMTTDEWHALSLHPSSVEVMRYAHAVGLSDGRAWAREQEELAG